MEPKFKIILTSPIEVDLGVWTLKTLEQVLIEIGDFVYILKVWNLWEIQTRPVSRLVMTSRFKFD